MALPTGGDYDLDAGLAGLLFRQELNAIMLALLSMNANASLPPETFQFMLRAALDVTPNEIQLRNPSDNAFLKLAEVTDSDIKLFSEGGAVPSLAVAQSFTAAQTIDLAATSGLFSVGSDLSTGVVARIPLFGHNSAAADTTGVNLVCRIGTNTAGIEDFTFEVEVVRGGASVTAATLGSVSDFRRSGGTGVLDADTLRQAGIELNTILREQIGRLGDGGNFSAGFTPAQTDEGSMQRFNGSGPQTITLRPLVEHTVVYFINESSSGDDLTFVSDISPNDVEIRTTRLTLPGVSGESPMCAVYWFLSGGNRVTIIGNNV